MIHYPQSSVSLEGDVSEFKALQWRNDRRVWFWCRQNGPISWAQHQEWLRKKDSDPTIRMYGIKNIDDVDVGVCGLTSIDRINRNAEFSLYVAPEFQRMGYATDALASLVYHAVKDQNLHRIWGESFDGNPAMGIFEELGFQKEGVKRDAYFRNGQFVGAHLYSILSGDISAITLRLFGA